MPRYAEVEGLSQPLEFPDDTPDAVMDVRVRQAVRDQQASNISAGQRRDAARARPPADVGGMGAVTGFEGYDPGGVSSLPTSALRMIAPTVGAALGAAGGGPFAPVTGAMGAAAGEGVNRLVGRMMQPQAQRPPVQEDLSAMGKEGAWSLAFPALARTMRPAGRVLGKVLPGSWRAQQSIATEGMDKLADIIPAEPTGVVGSKIQSFLAAVKGRASNVPLQQTAKKVAGISEEGDALAMLGKYFENTGEQKLAKSVGDLAQGPIPVDQMQRLLKRFGELDDTLPTTARNAARAIAGKLKEDLRIAAEAGDPQARKLLKLRTEYARGSTKEEIADLAQHRGVRPASANVMDASQKEVSPQTLHQILTRGAGPQGEELSSRFARLRPEEQQAILDELVRLSKYGRASGESWGRYAHPFAWLAGGTIAGASVGGPTGSLVGGTAGITAEKILERFFSTKAGQAAVRRLIENKAGRGGIAPALGALLGETVGPPLGP